MSKVFRWEGLREKKAYIHHFRQSRCISNLKCICAWVNVDSLIFLLHKASCKITIYTWKFKTFSFVIVSQGTQTMIYFQCLELHVRVTSPHKPIDNES